MAHFHVELEKTGGISFFIYLDDLVCKTDTVQAKEVCIRAYDLRLCCGWALLQTSLVQRGTEYAHTK